MGVSVCIGIELCEYKLGAGDWIYIPDFTNLFRKPRGSIVDSDRERLLAVFDLGPPLNWNPLKVGKKIKHNKAITVVVHN